MTPWIVDIGARAVLGLNALQVTTAARAGKIEVRESAWLDKRSSPVGAARARYLPDDLVGIERMVRLGAPALREAAGPLAGKPIAPLPVALGIAGPERPDVTASVATELLPRLAQASEIGVDLERSILVRAGQASFAIALEAAVQRLGEGAPYVLVGAVDSLVHPDAIAWLDEAHRLHAMGTEDGIIPSEGAAFALLAASEEAARAIGRAPIAAVRFARAALDELALDPEGPILATVLTDLVQSALVALGTPPAWLFTDLDEMHRVREWSRVELRCHPIFEGVPHVRVPDLFGDVGAATGAIAAAYACRSWTLGDAPRGAMIAAMAADGAARGVFALSEAPR
jgi:3-oxoacyl-[acyl-carrier-protein] synthase I